jgi:DNA-binding NtrC family response regulator
MWTSAGGEWENSVDNHNRRILLVDDEQAVRFVLECALRAYQDQYEVVTAATGREALERAQEAPLGLLVTDIILPGIDGVALTRAIRGFDPTVPVVWITGHGRGQHMQDARELCVFAYLNKPVEVPDFRRIVGEALASRPDSVSTGASSADSA